MDPTVLQTIALEVASAREFERVLRLVVEGVGSQGDVALARIWLLRPGDLCDRCALADECKDRTRCLHLVASAGRSLDSNREPWTGTDGRFRRFPMGQRKVGRVASTGEASLLHLGDHGDDWLSDPTWARDEGIRSFAAQPLIFRDEVLGVLAVFSRTRIAEDECFVWLRTFADQAAVAIANARAFEEVERLRAQLERERDYLREEVHIARAHAGIVGDSPQMRRVLSQVEMVAKSDVPVLILGESGTGKELIASAIHAASPRADGPMVRVNCASIPADLFESEFFGHTRGSFTGATRDRAGRFAVADGGTLFLDEVGEIPIGLQGKLLRVLQEGQFSPVGSDAVHTVDVRVVAATNRDLRAEAEAGRFREDLYYRLAVFPLEMPALRDRKQDIPELASHFLKLIASRRNAPAPLLLRRDVDALLAYDWPGNVRELQNVIERAVILGGERRLRFEFGSDTRRLARAPERSDPKPESERILTESERIDRMTRDIRAALLLCGGRVSGPGGAAELLGLKPTTLASRMKTLGIARNS